MARTAGSKSLWQLVVRLVADGSVDLPHLSTIDVTLETEPNEVNSNDLSGHAHFLISAYTKTPGVRVLVGGLILEPDFTFGNSAYVSVFRTYDAGPPAQWITKLHCANLTQDPPVDVTVFYRVYRWLGLN